MAVTQRSIDDLMMLWCVVCAFLYLGRVPEVVLELLPVLSMFCGLSADGVDSIGPNFGSDCANAIFPLVGTAVMVCGMRPVRVSGWQAGEREREIKREGERESQRETSLPPITSYICVQCIFMSE